MNATTAPTSSVPTPPANGKPVSPVEYVLGLAAEYKEDILIALIREVIAFNGGGKGLIPIETFEGESLGYFVPPLAADAIAERELPKLSPERERELEERLTQLHTAIPISQALAELKQQAERLQKQTP